MEAITLAVVNRYRAATEKDAVAFIRYQKKLAALRLGIDRLRAKYESVFGRPLRDSLPLVLAVPAHLAAATIEGLLLSTFFEAVFAGLIPNRAVLGLIIYLPILVFWGMTLSIGKVLHGVGLGRSEIVPGKLFFNAPALLAGASLAGFYLLLLYKLVEAARAMAPESEAAVEVIFWFGVLELVLGYFAVHGLEVIYAYGRGGIQRRFEVYYEKQLLRRANSCDRNLQYYLQTLSAYNRLHGVELQPELSLRIRLALGFSGFDTPAAEA